MTSYEDEVSRIARDGSGTCTAQMAVEETDGYLDIDAVELLDEDFQIVANIRNLSNTAKDKLTFTVFSMNAIFTGFLLVLLPQYYYIIYTFKAIPLLAYRWYVYKQAKFHYFFFDFCYFTSALVLIYLWLPFYDSFRAVLFPVVFGFACGPLLGAVVVMNNAMVYHSAHKMTSLFIHVGPANALWGIRWYSTKEQGFPLCSNPTTAGASGCDHIGYDELVLYPLLGFILWQIYYTVVVFFWRKERIEKRSYMTTYWWMVERSKKEAMYYWCGILGPRYRKLLFHVYHFLYAILSVLLAYLCFHYRYATVIIAFVVLTVASYNGATFYIDVFSHQYHNGAVNKEKKLF